MGSQWQFDGRWQSVNSRRHMFRILGWSTKHLFDGPAALSLVRVAIGGEMRPQSKRILSPSLGVPAPALSRRIGGSLPSPLPHQATRTPLKREGFSVSLSAHGESLRYRGSVSPVRLPTT
jgi:hypothetical protein